MDLTDIQNMVSLIDVVSQRGAFKGEELYDVGTLRNRLVGFIEMNNSQEKSEPELLTETHSE